MGKRQSQARAKAAAPFEFGPEHEAAAEAAERAAGSLTHAQVLAMVRAIQAAPGDEAAKKREFSALFPALALGYPVLFLAACRPGWDSSPLERMMGTIGAAATEEESDRAVGDMLFGRFVEPVLPPT